MNGQPQFELNVTRVIVAWSALVASTALFALLVSGLPDGVPKALVAFATGILITPALASPYEWMVHRYVYHRPAIPFLRRIYSVHLAHHHLYFPTYRYVTGGPPRRIPVFGGEVSEVCTSSWGNALVRASHFLFYLALGLILICLPAWLLTMNLALLLGSLLSLVVISNLFVTVHDAIHRPHSHRLLQRQPWFGFLDEHHYIHHVDEQANVNFLLPLADLLFGTLRRSLTARELREHGPREHAKAREEGLGEPARRTPWRRPATAGRTA
jgi:hemolysin III